MTVTRYGMQRIRAISRILLAALFIIGGALHFLKTDFYLRMMPPYLPYPLTLVYVSGIIEAGLGMLTVIPILPGLVRNCLVALLIAIFPANVQMAVHPELFPEYSSFGLWMRLPVQALLIAWVFYALPKERE